MTETTSELRVQFSKRNDGSVVLQASGWDITDTEGKGSRGTFTDIELLAVRKRINELHSQWASVPAGSVLELTFNRGGAHGNAG